MPRPPRLAFLILTLIAPFICMAPSSSAVWAKDDNPRMTSEQLDAFARAHPDASVLVLSEWEHFKGEYKPKSDGIHGRVRRGQEYWLRNARGVESVARVGAYDGPIRRFKGIKVEVESADGRHQKFDKGDLQWVKRSSQDGLVFTFDAVQSYAVIPGLRAGDRVWIEQEYEYKGVHGLPTWKFGGYDAPCAQSRFTLELPSSHTLVIGRRGPSNLVSRVEESIDENGRRKIYSWRMRDLQPHRYEQLSYGVPSESVVITPHVTSFGKEYPDQAFASGTSWEAVGQRYLNRIDEVFESNEEITRTAKSVVANLEDPKDRINELYTHVQKSCRYLGLFEGLDGIIPRPAKEVHDSGYGDCKGLSTLLITMLREVDIEAFPVLVRTRSAGPYDASIPNMTQFNHFTVWANDGKDGLWLDPTYDGCPAGVVPDQNAAWPVVVLRPTGAEIRRIPTDLWAPSPVRLRLNGELHQNGEISFELSERCAGSTALGVRIKALFATKTQQAAMISKRLLPKSVSAQAISASVVSLDDWRADIECQLSAKTTSTLPRGKNELFLPRILVPLPERRLYLTDRVTPIDLRFLPARIEEWKIRLPPGVNLRPVEDLRIEVQGLTWTRRAWQEENVLHLSREIVWSHEILPPEQLIPLVEALDRAHEAENKFLSLELTTVEGR